MGCPEHTQRAVTGRPDQVIFIGRQASRKWRGGVDDVGNLGKGLSPAPLLQEIRLSKRQARGIRTTGRANGSLDLLGAPERANRAVHRITFAQQGERDVPSDKTADSGHGNGRGPRVHGSIPR